MNGSSLVRMWRPGNKQGAYIKKDHYDLLSIFIVSLIKKKQIVELNELIEEARTCPLLPYNDLTWILLQVKLDLEAKGLIKVDFVGPTRLQFIKMKRGGRLYIRYLAGRRLPLIDKSTLSDFYSSIK